MQQARAPPETSPAQGRQRTLKGQNHHKFTHKENSMRALLVTLSLFSVGIVGCGGSETQSVNYRNRGVEYTVPEYQADDLSRLDVLDDANNQALSGGNY